MDRKRFEDMLADYLGDELNPQDWRAFEEHLAQSDADRAEVEALQAALRCLRDLPPAPVVWHRLPTGDSLRELPPAPTSVAGAAAVATPDGPRRDAPPKCDVPINRGLAGGERPESGPPTGRLPQPSIVRYLYRPLAYAAVLLIGIGMGWLAKPVGTAAPPAGGQASPGPAPAAVKELDGLRGPRLPDAKTSGPVVRNAYAMMLAFSQPTEPAPMPHRPGG